MGCESKPKMFPYLDNGATFVSIVKAVIVINCYTYMTFGFLRKVNTVVGKNMKSDCKIPFVIFLDWALASRPVNGLFSFEHENWFSGASSYAEKDKTTSKL